MLVSVELDADFSRACAVMRFGHSLFATRPTTLPFMNGSTPVLTLGLVVIAAAMILHCSDTLCGDKPQDEVKAILHLYRIAAMQDRENEIPRTLLLGRWVISGE